MNKTDFLKNIQSHIAAHGFHITVVTSIPNPRYAYTIGLTKTLGFELVFAGGINYLQSELALIFKSVVGELLHKDADIVNRKIKVDSIEEFSLNQVHSSWAKLTLLGVFDYYKIGEIKAYQIVPSDAHNRTIDLPNMSREWNPSMQPVWQWLDSKWNLPIPEKSTVVTNLDALLGYAVTQVSRWEEDEWEMFSGESTDVAKEDCRIVPIGTMLGFDPTLIAAINLKTGKGLWREDAASEWHNWGS